MARTTVTVTISQRWWLKYYLHGVMLMALVTQCEPDWDRVGYWVGRGFKLKVH